MTNSQWRLQHLGVTVKELNTVLSKLLHLMWKSWIQFYLSFASNNVPYNPVCLTCEKTANLQFLILRLTALKIRYNFLITSLYGVRESIAIGEVTIQQVIIAELEINVKLQILPGPTKSDIISKLPIVVSHSSDVCMWLHCNLFCRETSFLYLTH